MKRFLFLLPLAFAAKGCVQFGPKMVPPAGFSYNEAMAASWNQQLLLNLVRLRYDEPPFFLEPTQVLTGYTFSGDLGSSANLGRDGGLDDTLGFNGGLAYTERPTITYQPLTGEAFTKKMLTPIPPETLILLARSGWSVQTIVLALVQEINGLSAPFHPTATQPSPLQDVAELLHAMQKTNVLVLEVAAESGGDTRLIIQGSATDEARQVRSLLRLPESVNEFKITRLRRRGDQEISIVGRSLLDTLRHLSRAVDTPDTGSPLAPLLEIRHSTLPPRNAFVKVRHHGKWHYISNEDANSKALMGLLTQLFSLQASGDAGRSPLLTIPQ